jgi:5'-3' exonuclease
MQRAFAAFPVFQLTSPQAEADDLAFGLSRQLIRLGHTVTLHTADTDWLQMVEDNVSWANARKYGHVVSAADFENTCPYAFPQQVAQVKALAGDDSDDIPGVPQVALKRAQLLLARYGGLDGVLQAAADPLRFGREPQYFQSLADPAMRALVERNRLLVDLSRGPALKGADVAIVEGEFEPLDLCEYLVDLQFEEYQRDWRYWERALDVPVSAEARGAVRLALRDLEQSWPARAEAALTDEQHQVATQLAAEPA